MKHEKIIKRFEFLIGLMGVFIIILLVIFMNMNKKEQEENLRTDFDDEYGQIDYEVFSDVEDNSVFFRMENCLNLFYKYLDISEDDFEYDEDNYITGMQSTFAVTQEIDSIEEKAEAVMSLLNDKYIQENNLNVQNVLKKIDAIDLDKYQIQAVEEKVFSYENVKNYYVKAKVLDKESYEFVKYIYCMIYSNVSDDYFNIYFLDNEPGNLAILKNDSDVQNNKNNKQEMEQVSEREMAIKYFVDFKMNAINKTDYAFEVLDEEYRTARFDDEKENFDSFIDTNMDELSSVTAKKYQAYYYDDYIEYVCLDKYENYYIFKVTGVMQYTVKLDTYTIASDNFKSNYVSASDKVKIQMNVEKWITMLNNRDYGTAYGFLDKSFKNTYFPNLEDFENYMREYYPLHYEISEQSITEDNGIYSIKNILLDITEEYKSKNGIAIIMKLKNDLDFTMSFDIGTN